MGSRGVNKCWQLLTGSFLNPSTCWHHSCVHPLLPVWDHLAMGMESWNIFIQHFWWRKQKIRSLHAALCTGLFSDAIPRFLWDWNPRLRWIAICPIFTLQFFLFSRQSWPKKLDSGSNRKPQFQGGRKFTWRHLFYLRHSRRLLRTKQNYKDENVWRK